MTAERRAPAGERSFRGRSVVAGSAYGRFVAVDRTSHEVLRVAIAETAVEAELARLGRAVARAREELARTREAVPEELGGELAPIFDAQGLLLEDAALQDRIRDHIVTERVNAEWAVSETLRDLELTFAKVDTPHLKEKADDLRDIARALIRALGSDDEHTLAFDEPVVLFASDLTPSEAVRFARAGVAGFALEKGGQASHTAIIARALDLPVISGLAELEPADLEAETAVVDGDSAQLILDPDPTTAARYRARAEAVAELERTREAEAALAAETVDGVAIQLMANIDLLEELDDARRFGCEGIGLYRSEFLFIERSPELPTEEEQLDVLRQLLEAAAPHPAVVRTFDLGGRKLAREVISTDEANPVLGLRGIRLTLQRGDIFRSQVRAILRAGVHGRLRVLLPMVTGVDEIRQFRAVVADAAAELEGEGLPFRSDFRLGAMIEVPSAAMIADRLAEEVDFLSLGTNDLVQYALAVDRNNEHVAYLYQPFHPAILRMVRFVLDSARSAGIGVSVCGEVAADPGATALLVGLGLRRLSVTPRAIPQIKETIRALSIADLERVAARCLEAASPDEVTQILAAARLRGESGGAAC